jgi:hypothetical protein
VAVGSASASRAPARHPGLPPRPRCRHRGHGAPGQAPPVPATLPRRLGRRRRNLHFHRLPRRRPRCTARHGTHDVLQTDEYPIGSAICYRVIWEPDDTAAHIARQAAKAHAIIRAKTRETILSTEPSSFIKAEAERTQRDFDDALLTEGAPTAAREAVASLLASNRRSHATDAETVLIPPKIPPSPVAPPGKGEFPDESPESGCENQPEAENGL